MSTPHPQSADGTPPDAQAAGSPLGVPGASQPTQGQVPPEPQAPPESQVPPEPRAPAESQAPPQCGFDPVAGFLAMMVPGLGHWMRQQHRRAVYIAIGVFGLFLSGLFIGGIDVVDSASEDRIWFVGQAMVGPIAVGVDWVHQNHFKVYDPITGERRTAYPGEIRSPGGAALPAPTPTPTPTPTNSGQRPPNIKSMAKVNELGTLFCTVAGMMNLIVIIDATFPRRRQPPKANATPAEPDPVSAGAPA